MLLLLVSATLFTCKNDDCCSDPEIDEAWLNATVADIEKSSIKQYFYITRATYDGQCVVYVNNCCPMCSTALILYRCDGTKLENVDYTKIKNEAIVWHPDDFVCQLM